MLGVTIQKPTKQSKTENKNKQKIFEHSRESTLRESIGEPLGHQVRGSDRQTAKRYTLRSSRRRCCTLIFRESHASRMRVCVSVCVRGRSVRGCLA